MSPYFDMAYPVCYSDSGKIPCQLLWNNVMVLTKLLHPSNKQNVIGLWDGHVMIIGYWVCNVIYARVPSGNTAQL